MKRFGFDLLFEVQVPRPWTEGKERDKFHEALEQAVFAEQMGFDTVWIVGYAPVTVRTVKVIPIFAALA